MNEFCFGAGRGKVSARTRKAIDRIAKRHGVEFVNPTIPGNGPRYWFVAPNRGAPFDTQLAKAVYAELESAGLFGSDGRLRKKGEDK